MSNFELHKPSESSNDTSISQQTVTENKSNEPNYVTRLPDRITAGVLALLLGGVGVHKFYVGAWGWGLLYLLFCWTYIPTVLATVEGIRYLVIKNQEFEDSYKKSKGPFSFIW